jgi:Uma2 family endonuclease
MVISGQHCRVHQEIGHAGETVMIDTVHETAESLLERLQEGDRWIEVMCGRLVRHAAPDDGHGNIVRNLSKALALHIRQRPEFVACFELGLILSRSPDTVLCPAISCFPLPAGFDESDKLISETRPQLVIEIASTNDRRQELAERVKSYLDWGVAGVWVFDPVERQAHTLSPEASHVFHEGESLHDFAVLPGFRYSVAEAFRDPKWMESDPPE